MKNKKNSQEKGNTKVKAKVSKLGAKSTARNLIMSRPDVDLAY